MRLTPSEKIILNMNEDQVINEFNLILEKKSKLSSNQRLRVYALGLFLVDKGTLNITNNKLIKNEEVTKE